MRPNLPPRALGAFLLGAAAPLAVAHELDGAGGVTAALIHPLTGVDHLLALLAIGLWAGRGGAARAWRLPAMSLAGLAAGALGAAAGLVMPAFEIAIAASLVLLGLACAGARRAPHGGFAALVGLLAFAHGQAHGVELMPAGVEAAVLLAFLATCAGVHASGVVLGLGACRYAGLAAAMRGAGLAIAAAGGWLLAAA